MNTNIYSDSLTDNIELNDIGYLMAMTGSSDINKYAISKFRKQFGENGSFRVVSTDEINNPEDNPKEGLFSRTDDYISLNEITRKYPSIQEIKIEDKAHYASLIEMTNKNKDMVPLFLKDGQGELHIITSSNTEFDEISEGCKLVYLGKPFDVEEVAHDD